MIVGVVTGNLWATKKSAALLGQAFLTVRAGEKSLVCADCVGAGEGDTVLVATGGAGPGGGGTGDPRGRRYCGHCGY